MLQTKVSLYGYFLLDLSAGGIFLSIKQLIDGISWYTKYTVSQNTSTYTHTLTNFFLLQLDLLCS